MKTTFSPRSQRPRLGALVLALGLALGSGAATAESATPGQVPAPETGQRAAPSKGHGMAHRMEHRKEHHAGRHHDGYHQGQHAGHHMGKAGDRALRGLTRLHDDLKLDARQESLWQDAAKASREARGAMRENMRKEHAETIATLNQPGSDLRTIVKRMDAARAQGRAQHEAMQERWLAVYDALSPEQKEKARVFIKTQLERGDRRAQRGHHGRSGDSGKPGQPAARTN